MSYQYGNHKTEHLPSIRPEDFDGFLKNLRAESQNVVSGDGNASDLFSDKSPFRVMCITCQTFEVDINSTSGGSGSEWTGSWPGSLTLKCRSCGAAMSMDA